MNIWIYIYLNIQAKISSKASTTISTIMDRAILMLRLANGELISGVLNCDSVKRLSGIYKDRLEPEFFNFTINNIKLNLILLATNITVGSFLCTYTTI